MISYSAFYVTILALGVTVWTAWGGYGKNSEVGLSLKRVGPMPALKVQFVVYLTLFETYIACSSHPSWFSQWSL